MKIKVAAKRYSCIDRRCIHIVAVLNSRRNIIAVLNVAVIIVAVLTAHQATVCLREELSTLPARNGSSSVWYGLLPPLPGREAL